MCGSETFTTVVSSTSMKVQNITEMAMIQGLTCLCSAFRDSDIGFRAVSAGPDADTFRITDQQPEEFEHTPTMYRGAPLLLLRLELPFNRMNAT